MVPRILTVAGGMLLGASGALMYAASWQRWAGACRWGDVGSGRCLSRQDHLYDFVAPTGPWEPVGDAAQMALVGAVLALVAVGIAGLRSGVTGSVVHPIADDLTLYVWL